MKAFPIAFSDNNEIHFNSGMDLRDYFAAKAMPVIMLDWYEDGLPPGDDGNGQSIAELSYLMADAMMKMREK